jgi:hypothetical protein
MSEKVVIGGTPVFENPFAHCTFLGKLGGHDLYFVDDPAREPDVLARSGDEPGEYVEGLKHSWGADKYLTAARRIAEYKKLLPFNPVKALFSAHEWQDVAAVKRALPDTAEYAVLVAFHAGDTAESNAGLDYLCSQPEMMSKYPDSPLGRLGHVDMNLAVVAACFPEVFSKEVYRNISAEKYLELGGKPPYPGYIRTW